MLQPLRMRDSGRGERGAAVAELAIALPVLLSLLLVVFDFGRGFHAYISIANGARDAARVSMQDSANEKITSAARAGAGSYGSEVTFTIDPGTCGVPAAGLRRVAVSYSHSSILPFVGDFWDGNMSQVFTTHAKCP